MCPYQHSETVSLQRLVCAFMISHPRVMLNRSIILWIPHPKIHQPLLSLPHRQCSMVTPIIHIPIRQLRVKQHSIPYLGLYTQSCGCIGIHPTWELRSTPLHPLIEIQQQCGESCWLILSGKVSITKVMMGRVFLARIIMHQLQRLGQTTSAAQMGMFICRSGTEQCLVNTKQVGSTAVDGIDNRILLAIDPSVQTCPGFRRLIPIGIGT
mmetsp:Transcript_21778/g.52661  ORF Transcript_21778/g.52661 Transcript_21778/m.52661 type:complete len:210 (-) Transcript_21778:1114-1743(-)